MKDAMDRVLPLRTAASSHRNSIIEHRPRTQDGNPPAEYGIRDVHAGYTTHMTDIPPPSLSDVLNPAGGSCGGNFKCTSLHLPPPHLLLPLLILFFFFIPESSSTPPYQKKKNNSRSSLPPSPHTHKQPPLTPAQFTCPAPQRRWATSS